MPDLSIIIVSWNTRDILRECLHSVAEGLGNLDAEVFVVDNASHDGSAEMVADEFSGIRVIANSTNVGFAAANNQAIKLAQGKYVLLLNPDTLIKGDVLVRSFEYMERQENAQLGAMACRVLNRDGSVQLTCGGYPTLWNLFLLSSGLFRLRWPGICSNYQLLNWNRDTEREVETITGCYLFARAAAIQDVGLLDESFFCYGEETDWCRRFWNAGWPLRLAPVGEIVHFGSLSSRQCNYRRDVMLTDGLIRLHKKHDGQLSAMIAWCILWAFQMTRWGYWAVRSGLARSSTARSRRDHFGRVLCDFRSLWPASRSFSR